MQIVTELERIGEEKMLLHMMKARFGSLPAWAADEVKYADITDIKDWGSRFFSANSVKELLGEGHGMQYVTPAEQIAEASKILLDQIKARFGSIPQWAKDKIKYADIETIEELRIRFFSANSLEEVLSEEKKMKYTINAARRSEGTKILVSLMEARFGDLPHWVQNKIKHAGIASIEDWCINVLSADSPEEVLGETRRYVTTAERTGIRKMFLRLMESRFASLPQWAADKIEYADIPDVKDWCIRLLNVNSVEEVLEGK
ncbi:MAG: hypothetical protein GY749_13155 [Desulfobacteraceae bacterium]|nr:hypothetical protein [Desulfobacteraceae bacterium]